MSAAIRRAAGQCLKRIELTRRIRLLGVRAGSLVALEQAAAPTPDMRHPHCSA